MERGIMQTADAKAAVFYTAFKSMDKKERKAIIKKMLHEREFVEDLIDTVLIEQRISEPSRSIDAYLKDKKK